MELTAAERAVLDRFAEKCRIAGGPRAGYLMRRRSIRYFQDRTPELDLDQGIAGLVEKGLLKQSEGGDLLFLSAAGVERLTAAAHAGAG